MSLSLNFVVVRQESDRDFSLIRRVVKESFEHSGHSDGDEHVLIDRLRSTPDYIPELSLVAETGGMIVGHIMFSRIYIGATPAVALAPLAVLPSYWNQGIGQSLIKAGHRLAGKMGECCSVVLGSPDYYSKSGYLPASSFGILPPFDVPGRFYMVCPLNAPLPAGIVRYSSAFCL